MPENNSTYSRSEQERRESAKRVIELNARREARRKELEALVRDEDARRLRRRLAAR